MEIKLPPELDLAMIEEIERKPGMDKRSYVLQAIRHQIAADRGYRERADRKRAERPASTFTD